MAENKRIIALSYHVEGARIGRHEEGIGPPSLGGPEVVLHQISLEKMWIAHFG
ncbi:hypothetical protein THTE_0795 [Thermogutta terrifontis]|uniref:Uncharacterized protein n=1 Tax=Thermogutta terrifontis TaxID=1331910 RepID=A0A286RBU4_9BACT|nr:hypothetical protein THTE_0795 [Thermogutta terrifontis]